MASKTCAMISLGCPKNLVDSERMLGNLAKDGWNIVPDAEGADVVVVNTCGFIEPARQESLGVIRELLARKKSGEVGAVVVAGCLAERNRDDLLKEVPGVDRILGVHAREEIAQVVDSARLSRKLRQSALALEQRTLFKPAPVKAQADTSRVRATPKHYAYLKISEGCDRLCTFCAIPSMRGKHVSKPREEIVAEARELAADGVKELLLVAQDSTYYGIDIYGKPALDLLLNDLLEVEGLRWIRVHYAYPAYVTDELLTTFAAGVKTGKLLPYIDMPLQHISDRVLKRMARKVDRKAIEDLLVRMRQAIPGLILRSTFVVGFPGETEAEYQELEDFIAQAKFERLGVFPYSFEETTPSSRLDGHLTEEIKLSRRDRLMAVQQKIAFEWTKAQHGKELDLIVDGPDGEAPGWYAARSWADAPDVDTVVRLKGKGLLPGDIVRARINGADGYDLLARHLTQATASSATASSALAAPGNSSPDTPSTPATLGATGIR